MAFLRSISTHNRQPDDPRRAGLLLRTPALADYPQWAQLREESRAFLAPWEPIWPADDLTKLAFRRRIRRYQREIRNGTRLSLLHLLARRRDAARRHHAHPCPARRHPVRRRSATGWARRYAGKGYMTARGPGGRRLRLRHAAPATASRPPACRTTPPRSGSSKRSDSRREGYARKYLCIDGRWQDHLLFGLVRDDPRR